MKIALAQLNTLVGDLEGNCQKIIHAVSQAKLQGADIIVFSEMTLTGYPPRDLLEYAHFIRAIPPYIDKIASYAQGIAIIVGAVEANEHWEGKPLFNVAYWLEDGFIRQVIKKTLLPNYDVFDEERYFESGEVATPITYKGLKIGVSLCEDIWVKPFAHSPRRYRTNPVARMVADGAELIINLSASPFSTGRFYDRLQLIQEITNQNKVNLIYVNQVGGNDELVFDGGSMLVSKEGDVCHLSAFFKESLDVIDLKNLHKVGMIEKKDVELLLEALVLGLRDYADKCGFKKVVMGLSGGVDSALVAVLAVMALGQENVLGLLMPSRYSSQGSVDDSLALANTLGIQTQVLPIDDLHKSYEAAFHTMFEGLPCDVTEENIQARIRGNLIMSVSNKRGYLALTTGNKSEVAVGYTTLYGDMCGGLAVISDVPKTMVYELCGHINFQKEVIPKNILTKAPSAELRPNQTDQDTLPAYEILDKIIQMYVEEWLSPQEIINSGIDAQIVNRVVKMIHANEYKRRQAAPGLRVTTKAFGMGRRFPIACCLVEKCPSTSLKIN